MCAMVARREHRRYWQMLCVHTIDAQSVVRLHGWPATPVVHRPALLPPV